jgi:hypothetical protein
MEDLGIFFTLCGCFRPVSVFYGHTKWPYFMVFWYIPWVFGIFNGRLQYFIAIRYILSSFGVIYGHLVPIWYVHLVHSLIAMVYF